MSSDINEEHYKYYDYLEVVRRSGDTNMWGAAIYLQEAFSLSKQEARTILLEWIKHYTELCSIRGWRNKEEE